MKLDCRSKEEFVVHVLEKKNEGETSATAYFFNLHLVDLNFGVLKLCNCEDQPETRCYNGKWTGRKNENA